MLRNLLSEKVTGVFFLVVLLCFSSFLQAEKIHLLKARGELKINDTPSTDTYEAYFHVPIAFEDQVPLLIEIDSPALIDFRFVPLLPPNVIIAARLKKAESTYLHWTALVLVKNNSYADKPDSIPIPTFEQLPEPVRKWLVSTDCAQLFAPLVLQEAAKVRGSKVDLIPLAREIADYCYHIPQILPHYPIAFDAYYALNWGSSCTGHAHAGAALFRANGVPARSLLNIPTWFDAYMDMHWIIDYFVPNFGWAKMETSLGRDCYPPHNTVVVYASHPEDEFPVFFPNGIDGCWHSSDPHLGRYAPSWSQAHHADYLLELEGSQAQIQTAFDLTKSLFSYYTSYWGIKHRYEDRYHLFRAYLDQLESLLHLSNKEIEKYLAKIQMAFEHYTQITSSPLQTIFLDNFEVEENSWIHGGDKDEWEWGLPLQGLVKANSGLRCWGTDLDGFYENNTDCWLLSPSIDLKGISCAYLSFYVWNNIHDDRYPIGDFLWMDVTSDGVEFNPLCSQMGGVNDDPEIPGGGGWSRVVLDLGRYVGKEIRFRFRFQSNKENVQAGTYLDDIHVFGRPAEGEDDSVQLNLMAARLTDRAWLVEKDYADIEISAYGYERLQDLSFTILRMEAGSFFQAHKQIPGSSFQGVTYSFQDMFIEKGKSYRYIVTAEDAQGRMMGLSGCKTIEKDEDR